MNGQAEEQISRYTGRCDSIHLMCPQVHIDTDAVKSCQKSNRNMVNPAHLGVSWRKVEDPWRTTHVCLPQ